MQFWPLREMLRKCVISVMFRKKLMVDIAKRFTGL